MSAVIVAGSDFSFDSNMTAAELLPMLKAAGITLRSVPQKLGKAARSGFINLVAVEEDYTDVNKNKKRHYKKYDESVCNVCDCCRVGTDCRECNMPMPF